MVHINRKVGRSIDYPNHRHHGSQCYTDRSDNRSFKLVVIAHAVQELSTIIYIWDTVSDSHIWHRMNNTSDIGKNEFLFDRGHLNNTNHSFDALGSPLILVLGQSSAFLIITLNISFLVLVSRVKANNSRKRHHFLLFNLCVSDILVGVAIALLSAKLFVTNFRNYGLCAFAFTLSAVAATNSVMHMFLICAERFLAIRESRFIAVFGSPWRYVCVGCAWVIPSTILVLGAIFRTSDSYTANAGINTIDL